ncbi:MAG: gamma-butyrobetaine hydroxylase-like domain-containing protein [Chloroflexota bacterium]
MFNQTHREQREIVPLNVDDVLNAPNGNEPTAIVLLSGPKLVEITWADGHQSPYPFAQLRWACPCAHCRGEMGRPGILATTTTLTAAEQQLVDLQLVGRYALQPRWADGHETGIFAFEDLRAICPCSLCMGKRQRA